MKTKIKINSGVYSGKTGYVDGYTVFEETTYAAVVLDDCIADVNIDYLVPIKGINKDTNKEKVKEFVKTYPSTFEDAWFWEEKIEELLNNKAIVPPPLIGLTSKKT